MQAILCMERGTLHILISSLMTLRTFIEVSFVGFILVMYVMNINLSSIVLSLNIPEYLDDQYSTILLTFRFMQGRRKHWTVNYNGTQSFINILYYLLVQNFGYSY